MIGRNSSATIFSNHERCTGLPIQLKTVSADFFTYPTTEDDLVYTVQLKTILFTVQVKTILLYPTSEDDYITILKTAISAYFLYTLQVKTII